MRRRICSLVGVLGLLAGLAVTAAPAPAGAATVAVNLEMVAGGGTLQLRGAEPYSLAAATIAGSIDDETGVLSGLTFDSPQVVIKRHITSPLPANVTINATFSQVAPGTGALDADDNLAIDQDLTVTLDIEVVPDGQENPLDLAGHCVASPVPLTLASSAPYARGGNERVNLVAGDFTVPPVVANPTVCDPIIAEQVNKELAGSGHSLSLLLKDVGEPRLPEIEDGTCDTVTTLVVDPAAEAALGSAVTFTSTTVLDPAEADAECLAPTGTVDFFRGTTIIGSDDLDGSGVATLVTSGLPAGAQSLNARYRGSFPYKSSASAATAYRVTTKPTVSTTLPSFLPTAEPTEFEYTVSNSQFGAALDDVRVDITLRSFVSSPNLERWDGSAWQPVTILGGTPDRYAALPAFDLASGAERTEKLRLSPVAAAGAMTVSFEVKPDSAPPMRAPDPANIGRGEKVTSYFTPERIDSTITTTFDPDHIWPHTARQGQTIMLDSIKVDPLINTHNPEGYVEYFIDGEKMSVATTADPRPTQLLTKLPMGLGGVSPQALIIIPEDLPPGPQAVTARYSGDQRYRPAQRDFTFTVLPARGPTYLCFADGLPPTYFATNVEAQANLPFAAAPGALDLGNLGISVFADRGFITAYNFLAMLNDSGPTAVGELGLKRVGFKFSGGGTGTATGITQTFAGFTPELTPGPPATESEVDRTLSFNGETGSTTIAGNVGEVVPITLEAIEFDLVSAVLDVPYNVVCTPLGEPELLGEVRIAGVGLTVAPADSVRAGQNVTLTADVGNPSATGVVEFVDGTDTLGVATLGAAGKAIMTTDDLEPGTHSLKVRYYPGPCPSTAPMCSTPTGPVQVSPVETLQVLPAIDCADFAEEGNGAIVRLVYMKLLNRCPDQPGYDFWKAKLDGGTSIARFAATIAGTDEAIDQIVIDGYQTTLERNPSAADKVFWRNYLRRNGSYQDLLAALSGSPEFWDLSGRTRAGLVTRVYNRILDRDPSAADIDYWVGELLSGKPRSTVMRTIAGLKEPVGVIVKDSYDEILGIAPTAGELATDTTQLQRTGNRTALYIKLMSDPRFSLRAQDYPNFG